MDIDEALMMEEEEDEEEDFDLVSTDSMASCPMKGSTRYRKLFKNIVQSVFQTKATNGLNYENFKQTVLRIENGTPWQQTDREALFLHVICNQYADASGDSNVIWETWEDMKPYYDTKRLNKRRKGKRHHVIPVAAPVVPGFQELVSSSSAPLAESASLQRHNFQQLSEIPVVVSVNNNNNNSPTSPEPLQKRRFRHLEESELDEHGITVPEALKEVGLQNHQQLARRVKELADIKYINVHGCRPASNSQGLSIFRDPQELRNLVQFAAFEVLREQIAVDDTRATGGPITTTTTTTTQTTSSSSFTTPISRPCVTSICPPAPTRAPARQHAPAPSGVLFYTPTGADFMLEMDENHRVYWKDVLKTANVERVGDRLMNSFNVKEVELMLKELAMRCGQHHIRKFGTPVLKDNQRIYTRTMLPMMFATLNDVMHTLLLKK